MEIFFLFNNLSNSIELSKNLLWKSFMTQVSRVSWEDTEEALPSEVLST